MAETIDRKVVEQKIETDWQKFMHFTRTLEFKLFRGKLHQKAVNPAPNVAPDHVWVPVDSHNVDAPAPGEAIAQEQTPITDFTPPGTSAVKA